MSAPATSVIIVSRGRPEHLKLCLSALMRQDHPEMEMVLVADGAGLAQAADMPIKRVPFESANISEARNLGIAQAAGQSKNAAQSGLIGMMGTFIDTIVVCTMTGLAIIVTGVWSSGETGASLTASAFSASQ